MSSYDVIVRGGKVVDGSGGTPFTADVAIRAGSIVEIGRVGGSAKRELDADGLLVTPGFVDVHTHYDGQAVWSRELTPSSWHGVTTAVMGNCGVGFAPCRPEHREMLVRLMEGVEDIPGAVLTEGLDWSWESFEEYLQRLESLPHDIDFATQVPHSALRVYAMGERGARREPATASDRATMARVARECIAAGALGFSTSRTLNHRTSDGEPTPTLTAAEDELLEIAMALGHHGAGVLQVVSDFRHPDVEFGMLRRIVERSGRPLSLSLVQSHRQPKAFRHLLSLISDATSAGLPIRAQVCGRAVGIVLGLDTSMNPFSDRPELRALQGIPLAERVAKLRSPELRARLCARTREPHGFAKAVLHNWENMFPLDESPDYEPTRDRSIAALARESGRSPEDVALDCMLSRQGRGLLYVPFLNYADGSFDPLLEMLLHPDAIPGLGDGGAHVGMICDGSFPTHLLTHWTRDRVRGERLSIPWVVRAQATRTAEALGLYDRGRIACGYRADLNLIDYDALHLPAPEVAHDLPAGGRRLLQKASGYVATLVHGEVTYERGEATGALPGRLIRGAQSRGTQQPPSPRGRSAA